MVQVAYFGTATGLKQRDFLNREASAAFVRWASDELGSITCDLRVKPSPKVPGGIDTNCRGLEEVLSAYRWQANWSDGEANFASENWSSTKASLKKLSERIKAAVDSDNEQAAFQICQSILRWGGNRNPRVGAMPELVQLKAAHGLVDYLRASRSIFRLADYNLQSLSSIEFAGSMWTKIYALNAADGLPIYDSRVGAAAAALVEVYRIHTNRNWDAVPQELSFPIERYQNRTVTRLNPAGAPPSHLNRSRRKQFIHAWSSATVRLAWLMQAILERRTELFAGEGGTLSRMHAFEASLFMIGYDTKALASNIDLSGTRQPIRDRQ